MHTRKAVLGYLHSRKQVIVESEKRSVSYRLPVDLIKLINEESIVEGRGLQSGRVFNPSAVVERILRDYFSRKPPVRRGTK